MTAIVIMGVSAAGKSTVARTLGLQLGYDVIDADDLHPPANIAKMASGVPLDDDDRWPWLDAVGSELRRGEDVVVGCSALRRRYRDHLRSARPDLVFIHLSADRSVLARRAASRQDHFMPLSLLDSQLAALEPLESDETGCTVDVTPSVDAVVASAAAWITTHVG